MVKELQIENCSIFVLFIEIEFHPACSLAGINIHSVFRYIYG